MPGNLTSAGHVVRRCEFQIGTEPDDGLLAWQPHLEAVLALQQGGDCDLGGHLADRVQVGRDRSHGLVDEPRSVIQLLVCLGVDPACGSDLRAMAQQAPVSGAGTQSQDLPDAAVV